MILHFEISNGRWGYRAGQAWIQIREIRKICTVSIHSEVSSGRRGHPAGQTKSKKTVLYKSHNTVSELDEILNLRLPSKPHILNTMALLKIQYNITKTIPSARANENTNDPNSPAITPINQTCKQNRLINY